MLVDAESLENQLQQSYIIDIPYGSISMCNMYDPEEDGYEIEDYVGKINNKDVIINHRKAKIKCISYDNSITRGERVEYYIMIDGYCIPKIFNSFTDAFMYKEIWN